MKKQLEHTKLVHVTPTTAANFVHVVS